MDFLKQVRDVIAFMGPEKIAIILALIVLVFFDLRRKIRQTRQMLTDEKTLPESFSVSAGDSLRITLERRWYEGRWVYIFFGKPPYSHSMFDELTKPGGDYSVCKHQI